MNNKWHEFYKSRINSSYQDYFEDRYRPFLEYLHRQIYATVTEMGCGIGSVSKYLLKHGFICSGFDICPEMVELAKLNVGHNIFYQDDILSHHSTDGVIGVSHGVLEHFSDEQILSIVKNNKDSIHYVPLDKYTTPSFGDERLLPLEYWIDLVKPKEYFTFNNEHDLCFKI
jgi:2-polyprenyl-3-methyl-5-hydroxy-6-metoxy-1,4-benzoquinol methylase